MSFFAQQKFIRETLLRALLATQNSGCLDKRSGQVLRKHDEIIYSRRCRHGNTHHGEGNGRAWIIHSILEEFSCKRYVRPRFSAV